MSILAHGLRVAAGNTGVESGIVNHTTFTHSSLNVQSFDIAIPSRYQEGDLLIIAISADVFETVTAATFQNELTTQGLTLYPQYELRFQQIAGIAVAYKTLGASETSPITVNFGDGLDSDEGGQNISAHAILVRGYSLRTSGVPVMVQSSGSTPTYSSTAFVATDDMVITVACLDDDTGITLTSPSTGYTTIDFTESTTGVAGQASTLLTQYKVLTSSGIESPSSPSLSGFDDQYATITLELTNNSNVPLDYEANFGTPTYTITSFPSTASGVNNGSNDVLIAFDATLGSSDGLIMDLGANVAGLAIGTDGNGSLRCRCFDGSTAWSSINAANTAYLDVDISSYVDTFCTYYLVVDVSTHTLTAYVQPNGQGSSSELVTLGSNTTTATPTASVYGAAAKGYLDDGTDLTFPDLETEYEGVPFTVLGGSFSEIRYWAEDAAFDVSTFGTL